MTLVAEARRTRKTSSAVDDAPPIEVLRLRLVRQEDIDRRSQRITWAPHVSDNPGQRSSKKCCVFHRKKAFGESSSSDSDSDDERHDGHKHHHSGCCDGGDHTDASGPRDGSGEGHSNRSNPPPSHPPCSKAGCYCGTRFA